MCCGSKLALYSAASFSEADLYRDIKQGNFSPVYLLHGDEDYFIESMADSIENAAIDESQKSFNYTVFYGKDAKAEDVITTCRRFPMMSDRQVVVLREAQMMASFEQLLPYFQSPQASTVMIICHKQKKADARKASVKQIKKIGQIYESKKLYQNQIPAWIGRFTKAQGYTISPKSSLLLSEYLGNDLASLKNELDKLFLNVSAEEEINTEHIEEFVGINRSYNLFELQAAISAGNRKKMFEIVEYLSNNPKASQFHITMAISSLYNYFQKVWTLKQNRSSSDKELASKLGVHPFFLKEYKKADTLLNNRFLKNAFSRLLDYDLKSKGLGSTGNTSSEELFKEMMGVLFTTD